MSKRRFTFVFVTVALFLGSGTALGLMGGFRPWTQAVRVESATGSHVDFNGPTLDGCPFIARDDKTFFMASDRPGGLGGIDIWVSTRTGKREPWSAPVNLGAPINSADNDFCPTMAADGRQFYFVSNRPGGCGGDDIYTSRLSRHGVFGPVGNLGCEVNSPQNEASPFPLVERHNGQVLYFSSTRSGLGDVYLSEWRQGAFRSPEILAEVSSNVFVDGHPNVRHDGLEMFLFSNREGNNDIYSSSRKNTRDPWSTPVNLGPLVNSDASETRPSLSWDGKTLYFGSTRPGGDGGADHYMTTRRQK